jgi:putative endonuclease
MPEKYSIAQPCDVASLGERGESLAADFLTGRGYRLIISNFKVPVGRNSRGVQVTGEIDIVALDSEGVLCFVEVKTRTSEAFAGPLSAVDLRKQRQITRTSKIYKRIFGLWKMPARFDVVTVVMPPNEEPKVELTRGFWSAEKFRKRRWEPEIYPEIY